MKFTLLFYTQDWETGPVVDLPGVPSPGNVVWVKGRSRREESEMYYVDNIVYPEAGLDREDTVYLFVRPYTGYLKYGPRTETDRIIERLVKLQESVAEVSDALRDASAVISVQIGKAAEDVDDRQTAIGERLENISYLVEEIKEII